MIKDLGSGNKAYTCQMGHSQISFSENRLFDSGGYPAQSDTFRCREGIAFIEKGSFASTIHCVSEEPIFSPNVGGLISEFEEKMIVCNPSKSRVLPFRPTYLCREDEWLNQEISLYFTYNSNKKKIYHLQRLRINLQVYKLKV